MPNRDRGKFCVNESNFGTSEQIYTKIPVVSTPLLLLQLILLPLAPMCKEGFKIKDAQKEKE